MSKGCNFKSAETSIDKFEALKLNALSGYACFIKKEVEKVIGYTYRLNEAFEFAWSIKLMYFEIYLPNLVFFSILNLKPCCCQSFKSADDIFEKKLKKAFISHFYTLSAKLSRFWI